jgi:hypothetical protein
MKALVYQQLQQNPVSGTSELKGEKFEEES